MKMKITKEVLELLPVKKIFTTPNGLQRLKIDETLGFSSDLEVEPHTAYLSGNNLFSMGSYSYSLSTFPPPYD